MHAISNPVTKKDHAGKISGSDKYVADQYRKGMLYCRLVRSPHAKARIVEVKLPQLPEGYFAADKNDVPGKNRVPVGLADIPVFAEDTVEYIGDPVLILVGPDRLELERLAQATEVVYEPLPAVLDIHDATDVFHEYNYGKGDVEAALAEADFVHEEVFHTGHQEQAYLEPQGMMAEYIDGTLHVHGSIQCPYYVHVNSRECCIRVLSEFGLESNISHIINGHVPVRAAQGENPVKGDGKLIVIDGGFCRAYHPRTGIAGYTLIYNSVGMRLSAHKPFESTRKAVEDNVDIHSRTNVFETLQQRLLVMDTDIGHNISEQIYDLSLLLTAYREGIITEKQS